MPPKKAPPKDAKAPKAPKAPAKKKDSNRSWSDEELEALVKSVESFPCLYDKTHKDYSNGTIQAQARVTLSNKFLNCTPVDVFSVWEKIKGKFKRHRMSLKRDEPTGTGAEDVKKVAPWPLFFSLHYLNNHLKTRNRYSNVKQAPEEVMIDNDKENSQHFDGVANSLHGVFTQQFNSLEEMGDNLQDISAQLKDLPDGTKVFLAVGEETEPQLDTGKQDDKVGGLFQEIGNKDVGNKALSSTGPSGNSMDMNTSFSGFQKSSERACDDLSQTPNAKRKRFKRSSKAEDSNEKDDPLTIALTKVVNSLSENTPPKAHEEDPNVEEWANYGRDYGKKVGKLDEDTRRDIRYQMESMLYDAMKKK